MSKEFQWTDELVKKYAARLIVGNSDGVTYADEHLLHFKQSKTPKREWEILEFIHDDRVVLRRDSDGNYNSGGAPFSASEETCLAIYKIHSVRRLSDGEVFTIGDRVGHIYHGGEWVVKEITISKDAGMCINGTFLMNIKHIPPQPKPEPKKERIVITQYSNINIPEEKFPAIKEAIERVLNIEDGPYELYNIGEIPKLIRGAEEKAFNAGKERIGGFWNHQIKNWQYPTFQDYLKSKEK